MYRERIRENYEQLSRSYRRVADHIMSNYYDVSFMTAAQLATTVDVDTTTVVRFSQRLGYSGYPELLSDLRRQVKAEIYSIYEPQELVPGDPAELFRSRILQERDNLEQMQVHNPPQHVDEMADSLARTTHFVVIGEGYAHTAAAMFVEQLLHRGVSAELAGQDTVHRAATLMRQNADTMVIGLSATEYGDDVARTLELARQRGCRTLGIVGSLSSPVNRMADRVIYAPTGVAGPLPSIVALVAALSALLQIITRDDSTSSAKYVEEFGDAYRYLRERADLNLPGVE